MVANLCNKNLRDKINARKTARQGQIKNIYFTLYNIFKKFIATPHICPGKAS